MARINFSPDEIRRSLLTSVLQNQRQMLTAAAEAAVLSTPVGRPELWSRPPPAGYTPGNARGSWQSGRVGVSTSYDPSARDTVGSATIGRIRAAIDARRNPDAQFVIFNPAPHAEALDAGRASRQGSAMTLKAIAAALAADNTRRNL